MNVIKQEITYKEARSASDYEKAGELDIDLEFQDFENELKHIRTGYGKPYGGVILAVTRKKKYIGCIAVRKYEGAICELKRMYLRKTARERGIGSTLLKKAIALARELGYAKMRLDTLPTMQKAIQLYEKEGFYEIAPYRFNPVAGTRYYEKEL